MVRTVHAIGWLLAVALASSGCFGAQAKTILELPPLDMPAPPPRQVQASEPQMPAPVSLPGEPEHTAPSQQQPPPAQRAEAPRAVEPPKTETPAVEPPKADEGH